MSREINPNESRRFFTRIAIMLPVELHFTDESTIDGDTKDLSMGGSFIFCSEARPADTRCVITISFGAECGDETLLVRGRVIRSDELGMAIEFNTLDEENYDRLRRFMMTHVKDPKIIENECKKIEG